MTLAITQQTELLAVAQRQALQQETAQPQLRLSDSEPSPASKTPQTDQPPRDDAKLSSSSLSVDVNSPDYKFKVKVERETEAGDKTEHTVLNFYKRSDAASQSQGNNTDTLV